MKTCKNNILGMKDVNSYTNIKTEYFIYWMHWSLNSDTSSHIEIIMN